MVVFRGLYVIFYDSPDDYLQMNLVKILYLHVPSAWLAISFYFSLGIFSLLFLISKNPMYDIFAKSYAPAVSIARISPSSGFDNSI